MRARRSWLRHWPGGTGMLPLAAASGAVGDDTLTTNLPPLPLTPPSNPGHGPTGLQALWRGFMLATNVAEAQRDHAATLLRCARELLHVLPQASGAVLA